MSRSGSSRLLSSFGDLSAAEKAGEKPPKAASSRAAIEAARQQQQAIAASSPQQQPDLPQRVAALRIGSDPA